MKDIRIAACVVTSVLMVSAAAYADDAKPERVYSDTFNTCMDKSDGVTIKMRACNNAEIARLDKELNAAYKAKMDILSDDESADQRKALQASERAWLTYRDAECAFKASPEGDGTLGPIIQGGCMLDMLYDRVQELKE